MAVQGRDAECKVWRSQPGFRVEDGILKRITPQGPKIVIPEVMLLEMLKQHHEHPLAGHMGVQSTASRLKALYWWPRLRGECEEFVKNCVSCNQRSPYGKRRAPLQELPASDRPFDFVAIDIVGPLPRTENGDKYILSILDHFSRYLEMVPLPDQTAETVACAFVRR